MSDGQLQNRNDHDVERIVGEIAEQATTGTSLTPLPEEWVVALPQLDGVACKWMMMDSLDPAYLWWDGGDYYATELGPGLEEMEGRPLDRFEAEALLDGLSHEPVDMSEVPNRA